MGRQRYCSKCGQVTRASHWCTDCQCNTCLKKLYIKVDEMGIKKE